MMAHVRRCWNNDTFPVQLCLKATSRIIQKGKTKFASDSWWLVGIHDSFQKKYTAEYKSSFTIVEQKLARFERRRNSPEYTIENLLIERRNNF